MLVIIDNYDSFTYNLYQLLAQIHDDVRVYRNDAITVDQLTAMAPAGIILSPGPGQPCSAGICRELVTALAPQVPILGVCLGHQVIVEAFGGMVVEAPEVVHGKAFLIRHNGSGLFSDLTSPIPAGRYHSLHACPSKIPECLQVTATTENGEVMALNHRQYPCHGAQFHPESILTPQGAQILKNFVNICILKTPSSVKTGVNKTC